MCPLLPDRCRTGAQLALSPWPGGPPGSETFRGDRPWSDVSTTLEPLFDHSDEDGSLTPAECAAMLPRLEEIIDRRRHDADPVHRRRVEDTRELVAVMRACVDIDADLLFC
ncbi:hypothetical protein [Streptomyces sp. NPDC014894]|uniref:hypothetical protein n=1 Tax=Streptomyces sp. NPDC014894 TaxID=3364931 RepID=UPI0036F50452